MIHACAATRAAGAFRDLAARRSLPQQADRRAVAGQLPAGFSPAVAKDARGALPHAGQVLCSISRCLAQANAHGARQASGHRPSSWSRHAGQYRDPARQAGTRGRCQSAVASPRRPGGRPACCSAWRRIGAGTAEISPPLVLGAGHPRAGSRARMLSPLRRARASSQLSAASPGVIWTRIGRARAGSGAVTMGPGRRPSARRRMRRAGGEPARMPRRSSPCRAGRWSGSPRRTGSPCSNRG